MALTQESSLSFWGDAEWFTVTVCQPDVFDVIYLGPQFPP